jgi:predicted nucleic-acid-binding Zn-ribbon protein
MQKGKCLKCGSADVIPDVTVVDLGHHNFQQNLKAAIQANPGAWLFKGEVQTSLKAWVCGACGFTELYAKNPGALLAVHQKLQAAE